MAFLNEWRDTNEAIFADPDLLVDKLGPCQRERTGSIKEYELPGTRPTDHPWQKPRLMITRRRIIIKGEEEDRRPPLGLLRLVVDDEAQKVALDSVGRYSGDYLGIDRGNHRAPLIKTGVDYDAEGKLKAIGVSTLLAGENSAIDARLYNCSSVSPELLALIVQGKLGQVLQDLGVLEHLQISREMNLPTDVLELISLNRGSVASAIDAQLRHFDQRGVPSEGAYVQQKIPLVQGLPCVATPDALILLVKNNIAAIAEKFNAQR